MVLLYYAPRVVRCSLPRMVHILPAAPPAPPLPEGSRLPSFGVRVTQGHSLFETMNFQQCHVAL